MIPDNALERLKKILDMLPPRSKERRFHIERVAQDYGVDPSTIYRKIKPKMIPRNPNRNRGHPKWEDTEEYIGWVEIIAAIKHRSLNKNGHHISTRQAIKMAEKGFRDTRTGEWIQIPEGKLARTTCDRWLKNLDLNITKRWESPSVRFGATEPNEVWQFDMSSSDMCYFDKEEGLTQDTSWNSGKSVEKRRMIMLYSVIDDFSRVEYMEYHLCYGEDVESALRFLYRAMSSKEDPGFPFQGRPKTIYLDSGPVAKSGIFLQVMDRLKIDIKRHETPNKARSRTAARSKGKIERSFQTCKNSFESLFQFHKPQNLTEANEYLYGHVLNLAYSSHPFWTEKRIDVWHQNIPAAGIQKICDWEQYRDLARKPCERRVSNDRIVLLDKQHYLVDDDFRGKKVEVWRGILDEGLFLRSSEGMVHGPYKPVPAPIPFGKFHTLKKGMIECRREKIIDLARHIDMPKESIFIDIRSEQDKTRTFQVGGHAIQPESPTGALSFVNPHAAKQAIYQEFGIPLGRLNREQRQKIDQLLAQTLRRDKVLSESKKIIDEYFKDVTGNA